MKYCFRTAVMVTILLALLSSCGTKDRTGDKSTGKDTLKFYPVEAYFSEQVKMADSAGGMYKLSVSNGKNDSVTLSPEAFAELAKNFTDISISDSVNMKQYTESSFLDLGTNSYTFDYTGNEQTMPVKTITILADTATMQVKRVFINKAFITSDSTIEEKLGWKTDTSFYINRIISKPGKPVRTELITVAWNTK